MACAVTTVAASGISNQAQPSKHLSRAARREPRVKRTHPADVSTMAEAHRADHVFFRPEAVNVGLQSQKSSRALDWRLFSAASILPDCSNTVVPAGGSKDCRPRGRIQTLSSPRKNPNTVVPAEESKYCPSRGGIQRLSSPRKNPNTVVPAEESKYCRPRGRIQILSSPRKNPNTVVPAEDSKYCRPRGRIQILSSPRKNPNTVVPAEESKYCRPRGRLQILSSPRRRGPSDQKGRSPQ